MASDTITCKSILRSSVVKLTCLYIEGGEEAWCVVEESPDEEAWCVVEESLDEEAWCVVEESPEEEAWCVVEESPEEEAWCVVEESPEEEAWCVVEESPEEEAWCVVEESPEEEAWCVVEESPDEEALFPSLLPSYPIYHQLSHRMFLVTCFMDFCSYDCHAKDIQYHGSCAKASFPDLKQAYTTSIAVYSLSIIETLSSLMLPWPHPLSHPRPLISLQLLIPGSS